jgi:hypothetical protein
MSVERLAVDRKGPLDLQTVAKRMIGTTRMRRPEMLVTTLA